MELFSNTDWKNLLKTFIQSNCVQVGTGLIFHLMMELLSKSDWNELLTNFICISCLQVGAVFMFLLSKPDRKDLFKLFTTNVLIQIGVGFSILLITELISKINWKIFLMTFICTSCFQVLAGFFWLVFMAMISNTAQNNVLETFIKTNCIQVVAGILFLIVMELVSNAELRKLIVQPNVPLSSDLFEKWASDLNNLLTTFLISNGVQVAAGFIFLVLKELFSKTVLQSRRDVRMEGPMTRRGHRRQLAHRLPETLQDVRRLLYLTLCRWDALAGNP
ncbi:uncharacterized protein LOC144598353 [Rhinoraja longicauda]